jgi:hypothetical protein
VYKGVTKIVAVLRAREDEMQEKQARKPEEPCKCGKMQLCSWWESITDAGNEGTDYVKHTRESCLTLTERKSARLLALGYPQCTCASIQAADASREMADTIEDLSVVHQCPHCGTALLDEQQHELANRCHRHNPVDCVAVLKIRLERSQEDMKRFSLGRDELLQGQIEALVQSKKTGDEVIARLKERLAAYDRWVTVAAQAIKSLEVDLDPQHRQEAS